MSKWKFTNPAGNHGSQGFVLDNEYEATRHASKNDATKFFLSFTVNGNVSNIWETEVMKYFTEVKTRVAPALQQTIIPAAAPKKEVVKPISEINPANTTILAAINKMATECADMSKGLAKAVVEQLRDLTNVVTDIAKEEINAETKDVLIVGLLQLKWDKIQITLSRANGKNTIMVIMDGMPPLSVTAEKLGGANISQLIVDSFGEKALIKESIDSFKAAVDAKEKELKKAVVAKPKTTKSRGTSKTVVQEPVIVPESVITPAITPVIDDMPVPASEPVIEPEIVEPGISEPGAQNVSDEVRDFNVEDMP